MVDSTMDGLSWVRKQVEEADTDLLREMVKLFVERLMGEEADAICGASYGERSKERTNRRNGYRSRPWDSRTGTIDLQLPKQPRARRPQVRSQDPDLLERRAACHRSSSPPSLTVLSSPSGGARMRAASTTWEYAMVGAIVLVQVKVGRSSAVAQAVGEIGGVTEAYVVTGPYDVIVRVEADSLDELGQMVASRIQAVEGVSRTLTCPILSL